MIDIRQFEKALIALWFLQDMSWFMEWRIIGVLTIVPTFIIAVIINWRLRDFRADFLYSMAVTCWVIANAFWMVSEFFSFDIKVKDLTIIPFTLGMFFIVLNHIRKPRGITVKVVSKLS